jgi:hypothetical protein
MQLVSWVAQGVCAVAQLGPSFRVRREPVNAVRRVRGHANKARLTWTGQARQGKAPPARLQNLDIDKACFGGPRESAFYPCLRSMTR